MTAGSYWHGCNYPWSFDGTTAFYGLDFGANVWGSHLGVSTRRDAVARDFDLMARLGFTITRWFLFGDGRGGIVYDDRGLPESLDAYLFDDLDTALEIALATGVRVAFVMLDHRWMYGGLAGAVVDPVTGDSLQVTLPEGRADVLHLAEGRELLLSRVLDPIVRRYGPAGARADLSASVAAYELMNEPDFVIDEWDADRSRHVPRPLPFALLAESDRAIQRAGAHAQRGDHDARRRPAAQPVGVGGPGAGTRSAAGALLSRPPASGSRRRHLRYAGGVTRRRTPAPAR